MTTKLRARWWAASLLFAISSVATLITPNVASAEAFTFAMDDVFYEGAGGSYKPDPDGPSPWLFVKFEDKAPGVVEMTLTSNLTSPNFLKDKAFYLNYDPHKDASKLEFAYQSGSGLQASSIAKSNNGFKADGTGGKFDILLGFGEKVGSTKAGPTFGVGATSTYWIKSSELTLTARSFLYTSVDSDPLKGGFYAASHIQRITDSAGSTWVGARGLGVVPEPPSIVMTGLAGVLGLGAAWRRRKRTADAV